MVSIRRNGVNRGLKSSTATFPSPIKGWNAKDSLAQMDPECAIKLINFFPNNTSLDVRKGYDRWATSITGEVNSLMAYNGLDAKLFAASGENIYDVTSSIDSPVPVVSDITNDKFIHVNITTSGGTFLVIVNGEDEMRVFDGTLWNTINSVSTPAITGVATEDLSYVTLSKNRLWFVEKNTTKAWYSDVNSFGGALTEFNLGAVFIRGGTLKAISSWSITGGFGAKDLTAFISTEGDIAVYEGIDPSNVATWSILGIYNLGSPIGIKPFSRLGTDLLVLTKQGLSSLSQGQFFADVSKSKISLTDKITPVISHATSAYGSAFGWQTIASPVDNMLIINIPITGRQEQYVMNTISGAWCQFTGLKSNCWALFNDVLYYGTTNGVNRFGIVRTDNGAQILASCLTAFNQYKNPARKKAFKMIHPTITFDQQAQMSVGMEVDYKLNGFLSNPTLPASDAALWDVDYWDSATWGGLTTKTSWINVQGIGYCGALQMKVATKNYFSWQSTDFVYQVGGIL